VREATSTEVKDLRAENSELNEVVTEMTLKNRVLKKKSDGSWRQGRHMRRTASEKMELIGLVERTDLPVRVTLRQLGIAPSTFYGWYKRYLKGGFDALHDKLPPPRPRWNKVPDKVRADVIDLALKKTELSARELACHLTDERRYFLSESSVYRILKAADLITSPAYVLMSASDRFKHPTQRVREMWQTDFPRELEAAVRDFVSYYNHHRYHESLDNCTRADVYYGRQHQVLSERDKIKQLTMQRRKKEYRAAKPA